MKKIIGLVLASLMFANIGFAEMRIIEEVFLGKEEKGEWYMVATICVDGYKFVITARPGDNGTSMVQFFEERDGKSLPAKC